MNRMISFLYGLFCYAIFFGTFVYAVGFLANSWVPKAIDSVSDAAGSAALAAVVNLMLLGLFAVQHSIMARPGFKAWWTRFVPVQVERSTYTLLSSLVLGLLFWQWRPMTSVVWEVESPILSWTLRGLFFLGFLLVLYASFLINHFDLFGLRQVYLYLRGIEYTPLKFGTPSLYRFIRHPLYVGWFLAFWATPAMTQGHLLFASVASAYILAAIVLEERDLMRFLGEDYRRYRQRVPMFVPRLLPERPPDPRRGGDMDRVC